MTIVPSRILHGIWIMGDDVRALSECLEPLWVSVKFRWHLED